MANFAKGIKTLFTGADTSAQDAEVERQRQQQTVALDRQLQEEQTAEARTDTQLGAAGKLPRGRRLLLAATGDRGLSSTLGG